MKTTSGEIADLSAYKPYKKRKGQKRKRSSFSRFVKWLKLNPLKFIAILLAFFLVYITILFIRFNQEFHRKAIPSSNQEIIIPSLFQKQY